jgi:hypothetical protein
MVPSQLYTALPRSQSYVTQHQQPTAILSTLAFYIFHLGVMSRDKRTTYLGGIGCCSRSLVPCKIYPWARRS